MSEDKYTDQEVEAYLKIIDSVADAMGVRRKTAAKRLSHKGFSKKGASKMRVRRDAR